MSIRKIYINPGETIQFRIIKDSDLEKNSAEWNAQTYPESILITFHTRELIEHAEPALQVLYDSPKQKILLSPQLIDKKI